MSSYREARGSVAPQFAETEDSGLNPGVEVGAGPSIDLKALLLYGVGRSWIWVLLFLALGSAGGLLVAAAQPNVFRSTGMLRLTSGKREMITPETTAGFEESLVSPPMGDELLLLTDIGIYEEVASRLGPDTVLQPSDPGRWDGPGTPLPLRWLHKLQSAMLAAGRSDQTSVQAAGSFLKDSTVLSADRFSSIISVSFTATDPDRAQKMARTLMEAFVERHAQAYAIGGYLKANKQEREDALAEQAKAEEAYQKHVELCGYYDLPEQTTMLIESTSSLDNQLQLKRAELSGVEALLTVLEARKESISATMDRIVPATQGPNPQYEKYQELVYELRAKEVLLKGSSLSIDERVHKEEDLAKQLAELQKRMGEIDAITTVVKEFKQEVSNPEFESLAVRIAELKAKDSGLRKEIVSLEDSLGKKMVQLENARKCQPAHADFERNLTEKRTRAQRLASAASDLEALSKLEEQGDSNLRLFQPPALPQGKVGPQRAKTALIGVALGLMLGLGVAVLRQLLDPRVRYARTLARELGLTVIGVLPDFGGLDQPQPKRARAAAKSQHGQGVARGA